MFINFHIQKLKPIPGKKGARKYYPPTLFPRLTIA